MPALLPDFLLLLWVLISVFSIGLAICHRCFRLRGIDLLGYGAGAGIFVHAVIGSLIAIFMHVRLVALQLACNVVFIWMRAALVGAHW